MNVGGFELGTVEIVAAAVTVLVLLLTIVFFGRKSGKARRTVALLGPSGAGKTLVFSQLTSGQYVETQTSMEENVGTLQREKGVRACPS